MKILVKTRTLLLYVGALEFDHPKGRLISQILLFLGYTINIFSNLTTLWFFIFDAENMADQTNSLASIIMLSYIIWIFTIFIWKRDEFMALIESFETQIEKRTLYLFVSD